MGPGEETNESSGGGGGLQLATLTEPEPASAQASLTSTPNPLTQASRPPESNSSHITECATTYSVVTAAITSIYTTFHIVYAFSSNRKLVKFYGWVFLPIAAVAAAIAVNLKPRREDWKYKTFLKTQLFALSVVSEVCYNLGSKFDKDELIRSASRLTGWFVFFLFLFKVRKRLASLPDARLSDFLINNLFKQGLCVGIGQLAFLMFDSFRCDFFTRSEGLGWQVCKRTLYSQTGLGGIVALYLVIKITSGLAPSHIISKHTVNTKKFATMELNKCDRVSAFGACIAGSCSLYLLGQFGADGDFQSESEEWFVIIVMMTGGIALLLSSLAVGYEVRKDMRAEEAEMKLSRNSVAARKLEETKIAEQRSKGRLIKEASYVFVVAGVMATAVQLLIEFRLVDIEPLNAPIVAPLLLIIYLVSFFAKPARKGPKYMTFLYMHFSFYLLLEAKHTTINFRDDQPGKAILHIVRAFVWSFIFRVGLKLRASVGRLPEEQISKFLMEAIFAGAGKTLAPVLFVTFRSVNCIVESIGQEFNMACDMASHCSAYISIYLTMLWCFSLAMSSVREEWFEEIALTPERIASMNLSIRQALQGFLLVIVACCGIFLFAYMNAEHMHWAVIRGVGLTGVAAAAVALMLEAFSISKAQKIKREKSVRQQRTITTVAFVEGAPKEMNAIEECSWMYIFGSALQTKAYVALIIMFAVTLDNRYRMLASMFLPLVVASFIMTFFMKPLNTENWYKKFQQAHFFLFAILTETLTAVGQFRKGEVLYASVSASRIFLVWTPLWILGHKLLNFVRNLDKLSLSSFLSNTVIIKCSALLAPMMFFSFETLQCVVEEGIHSMQCRNTAVAAVCLSSYLVCAITYTIVSKAVPQAVQKRLATSWSSMATLDLRKRKIFQAALLSFSEMCSLLLFSVIGVVTEPSSSIFLTGAAGGFAAVIALVLEIHHTIREYERYVGGGSHLGKEGSQEIDESDRVSGSDFSDGVLVGALI